MHAGLTEANPETDKRPVEIISGRVAIFGLCVLVGCGLWLRLPGLSTANALYRDDAWVALPARVSLSNAVHMVTTIPLFTLTLRSWIQLSPQSQLWAQLPAFAAGIAAIIAIYALCRSFSRTRLASLVTAAIVTVSPVAIDYSVRVKAYSTELLLAVVLLYVAERARRSPAIGTLVVAAFVEVGAYLTSAAVAPVIAAISIVFVIMAIREPKARGPVAANLAIVGIACLTITAIFFTDLSSSLRKFWNPYYLSFDSAHQMVKSSYRILGGLLHGFAGIPHDASITLWTLAVLALCLAFVGFGAWRAVRRREVGLAPAGLTIVIAVVLAALSLVPLGTGRTDEVLYGPLALIFAFTFDEAAQMVRRAAPWRLIGTCVLAVALGIGFVVSLSNRSIYPTSAVGALEAKVHRVDPSAPFFLVDASDAYPWAYYGLSPWRLEITNAVDAGFTVHSTSKDVFIAYASPGDRTYAPLRWVGAITAQRSFDRLWFFGIDASIVSPSDGRGASAASTSIHRSPVYLALIGAGWVPQTIERAPGVFAQLFTHTGSPAPQR